MQKLSACCLSGAQARHPRDIDADVALDPSEHGDPAAERPDADVAVRPDLGIGDGEESVQPLDLPVRIALGLLLLFLFLLLLALLLLLLLLPLLFLFSASPFLFSVPLLP